MSSSFRLKLWRALWVPTGIILFIGCIERNQQPIGFGVDDWQPKGIGGPVEVRPMPLAKEVLNSYTRWMKEGSNRVGRVYEFEMFRTNILNIRKEIRGGETPLGFVETTWVEVDYYDSQNGRYELFWLRRGRHDTRFLKRGFESRIVWCLPTGTTNAAGYPRVQLVGIEGVAPDKGVFARPVEQFSENTGDTPE